MSKSTHFGVSDTRSALDKIRTHLPAEWQVVNEHRLELARDNEPFWENIKTVFNAIYDNCTIDGWGIVPSVFVNCSEWTDEHVVEEACSSHGWTYVLTQIDDDEDPDESGYQINIYEADMYAKYQELSTMVPDIFSVCLGTHYDSYTIEVHNKFEIRVVGTSDDDILFSMYCSTGTGDHHVHIDDYPHNLIVVEPDTNCAGGCFTTCRRDVKSAKPIPNRFRRQIWCEGKKVVDVPSYHDHSQERRDIHLSDDGVCMSWSIAYDYLPCMVDTADDYVSKKIGEFYQTEARKMPIYSDDERDRMMRIYMRDPVRKLGSKNVVFADDPHVSGSIKGVVVRHPRSGYLMALIVSEDMRRQNVGRTMVHTLFGTDVIRTLVLTSNTGALAFFKSMGFEEDVHKTVRGNQVVRLVRPEIEIK